MTTSVKHIFKAIAVIGLLLTAGAPTLTFLGAIDVTLDKKLLAAGMILWFAAAPSIMKPVKE